MAPDSLTMAYEELCKSYHAIDDFRAKLLGFLPAATGAGILFTAKDNAYLLQHYAQAIGLFGFVIALGLFSYEIYGIRKCAALMQTGRLIERQLGIEGQFATRPHEVLWVIDEPFATALIYPAVLASWAFLFFYEKPCCGLAAAAAALVFVGLFVAVLFYDHRLSQLAKKSCDACGRAVAKGEVTCTRTNSVSIFRDYWLCNECDLELSSWLAAKTPGVT